MAQAALNNPAIANAAAQAAYDKAKSNFGSEFNQEAIQEEFKQNFEQLPGKMMIVDEKDKLFWELVTDVPLVSRVMAVICALLNVLLPGLGTCVAACAAQETVSKTQLGMAAIQFLTAVMLIGYLLSFYWAYLIVMKAWSGVNTVRRVPSNGIYMQQSDMI